MQKGGVLHAFFGVFPAPGLATEARGTDAGRRGPSGRGTWDTKRSQMTEVYSATPQISFPALIATPRSFFADEWYLTLTYFDFVLDLHLRSVMYRMQRLISIWPPGCSSGSACQRSPPTSRPRPGGAPALGGSCRGHRPAYRCQGPGRSRVERRHEATGADLNGLSLKGLQGCQGA